MTTTEQQTGTLVLDPTTMSKALTALNEAIGTGRPWVPIEGGSAGAVAQQRFLDWHAYNASAVEALSGLNVAVDTTAGPLNAFLQEHGFDPMFREFCRDGIGACAILDMLVEWAVQANLTSLEVYSSDSRSWTDYTAFEVPVAGIEVFTTNAIGSALFKLNTKDGGAVWLIMSDRPDYPQGMIGQAELSMATRKPIDPQEMRWITSVIVPTLEINQQADLAWMLGASSGGYTIDQAFQVFKLRMNQDGARIKTASGFGATRGARSPQPIRFDKPFLGWFTQSGSDVPVGIFYADKDSWKASTGTLADL